ncbi:MAG: hypothetical protein ACFB0C_20275 [Leptolyngbyaceae cyanobacterium]
MAEKGYEYIHSAWRQVSKRNLLSEVEISASTLKKWRLGGVKDNGEILLPKLIEDIHWSRVGSQKILYNIDLIKDFLHNQRNPEAHNRAIDLYLKSLPSSFEVASDLTREG